MSSVTLSLTLNLLLSPQSSDEQLSSRGLSQLPPAATATQESTSSSTPVRSPIVIVPESSYSSSESPSPVKGDEVLTGVGQNDELPVEPPAAM